MFKREPDFENALVDLLLAEKGWEEVLTNLAEILYENNMDIDRLNDQPPKLRLTEANINEFGRFGNLMASVDLEKAKAYFEEGEGATVTVFETKIKASALLREFLLKGAF